MSILFLCRGVSEMTPEQMNGIRTNSVFQTDRDSLLLFLFFLVGSGSMLLGQYFVPWLLTKAQTQLSLFFVLLPVVCALLAGSTVWGIYLIPASSFVLGALIVLFTYRDLPGFSLESREVSDLLTAVVTVPVFFTVGVFGLRNASALLMGLRLSGKSAERAAMRLFGLRWLCFAVLLLCFFLLHGTLYREF